MQLFHHSNAEEGAFTLPQDESKHVVRVLRKSVGDLIHVTDGKGRLFEATIAEANKNRCELDLKLKEASAPMDPALSLVIAPTKSSDRMEWLLEKAVEIGISRVVLVKSAHSERQKVKPERWERIMISAMKQSLRYHLPEISEIQDLSSVLGDFQADQKFIAHCDGDDRLPFIKSCKPGLSTAIAIGPEGDFSSEEVEIARSNGWKGVTLGDRRLRTETAALVSIDAFQWIQQM